MKKRVILILSTITLVTGSSYFLTGMFIQKNYSRIETQLNQRSDVRVSLISYERGISHSQAKVELSLPIAGTKQSDKFILVQRITHGPIVAVSTPSGVRVKILAGKISTHLEDTLHQAMIKYTGNKDPISVTTIVAFDQQAITWIKLAAIDQATPNNFKVSWASIVGEIKNNFKLASYESRISIPKLNIKTPEWMFNVSNVAINANSSAPNNTYSNNNAILIKSLSFLRGDNENVNLENIALNLDITIDQAQKFAINFALNIANSKIQQQVFADDTFTFRLNNIPASNVPSLALFESLSPRSAMVLMQQLTADENSNLDILLPKHFTETLTTYLSYEIYRNSILGKIDQRSEAVIIRDISNSIKNIVQGAVKQKLFIDQGAYYALNFNKNAIQKS